MPRVGVILSGCGYLDGAEIREAVIALLALDRAGAEVICMAPDRQQRKVVDHLTGKAVDERRNVRVESARIARGDVRDLAEVDADDLDALVMPGGFGAALNLSDFAERGTDAEIDADVARLLKAMYAARKPIGAICIAPSLVALALGAEHPRLTIGEDTGTARALEGLGALHQSCAVQGAVVDRQKKIVSCAAYMYDAPIRDVAAGIEKLVAEVVAMCG